MIRNLKALALALCAVFMFGALSVSVAAAATDLVTSPVNDTYLTGTQVGGLGTGNAFGTKWEPNGKIECATATYTGTFVGASTSEVSVTPSFGGCKSLGVNATFDFEGCKFVLTGNTDPFTNTNGQAQGEDATVRLDCADTGQFRVTGPLGCVITFKDTHPANTKVNQNLLGVAYDNELNGTKWDIKATVTLDKLTYTSTAACQTFGITATDSDGFLTSNVTIKGYEDAAHTKQINLTTS